MTAALLAALAFGTVWFWIVAIVVFIIITTLVENEHGTWAFLSVTATVLFMSYAWGLHPITYILTNPLHILLLTALYFAIGTGWGVVKWALFVQKQIDRYNEIKANVLRKMGIKEINPEAAKKIRETVNSQYSQPLDTSPDVGRYKSDLLRWMTYWPFSIVGTLLHDIVKRIFNFIYARMSNLLQSIADSMTKNVKREMEIGK